MQQSWQIGLARKLARDVYESEQILPQELCHLPLP